MSETTRMRAPYFELQMGAGPSLLLDELRILRERNEQQHAEAAELRRQIDEQAGQMALQRARIAELEREADLLSEVQQPADAAARIAALEADRETYKRLLADLLAVVHRDGGHYVWEHGWDTAATDAHTVVLEARAENARLRSLADGRLEQMDADRKQALRWRDEVERLRPDAERYRWLRDPDNGGALCVGRQEAVNDEDPSWQEVTWLCGDELDAAIDAARSQG